MIPPILTIYLYRLHFSPFPPNPPIVVVASSFLAPNLSNSLSPAVQTANSAPESINTLQPLYTESKRITGLTNSDNISELNLTVDAPHFYYTNAKCVKILFIGVYPIVNLVSYH